MKRQPPLLVEYLYRESSFPHGSFLMTGTGVVPPDSFTLARGDEIRIGIAGIGTLFNTVEQQMARTAKQVKDNPKGIVRT